jgi:hypothetical protein
MPTKLYVKSEGKRPFGVTSHRWEDYIKVDTGEIDWESVDWMYLIWAPVNLVMNILTS